MTFWQRCGLCGVMVMWGGALLGAQVPASMPAEVPGLGGGGLRLYPLGWSSEGRWAALIGREGQGGDSGIFMLVIDAVTDEELYRSGEMEWQGAASFARFWERYGRSILLKMESFDIEREEVADVRDPEFMTASRSYRFSMLPPSPATGPYVLKIAASGLGDKVVFRVPDGEGARQSFLMGVLISPFEARALAVVRQMPRYGGGTPSYRFSGAHLQYGFSSVSAGGAASGGGEGRGSLVSAVLNGQEYLVRARLSAGADPDVRDSRGTGVLVVAARLGYWVMVRDLVDAGASVNQVDADGRSALHYAAFFGATDAVRHLVSAGADTDRRDRAGRLPIELATDASVQALLR